MGGGAVFEEEKEGTTVELVVSFPIHTFDVLYGSAWELKDTASKGWKPPSSRLGWGCVEEGEKKEHVPTILASVSSVSY